MRASTVAAVALAALLAGCGGHRAADFRIGVLEDCYGPFSSTSSVVAAAAALPLVERGAKTPTAPLQSVGPVTVGGRRVFLDFGCAGGAGDVIPEARRLVEEQGVRAVIGALDPVQGMVLLSYARHRPETVFLVQPSDSPDVTRRDAAPNVFRFAPDAAQEVAGLGTYAYEQLGWRTAVTIGDDVPYGWSAASAFIAEFCALGGRVVERAWIGPGMNAASVVSRATAADGAYFGVVLSPAAAFLKQFAAERKDAARHLVATAVITGDPTVRKLAAGVVSAGTLPPSPMPALKAYISSFAQAFPALPADAAVIPLVVAYRDGVEAVVEALGRGSEAELRASLASLTLRSPLGILSLDRNRQAIVKTYLSRIGTGDPVRTIAGVTESFGGLFSGADPPASRTTPPCVRRAPAPWAR